MRQHTFVQDARGNVAMLFGLLMVPLCLLVGAAVEYGRATGFREFARSAGDSAALTVASADTPDDGSASLAALRGQIEQKFGDTVQNLAVSGAWIDASTYGIRIDAALKTFLLQAVPNFSKEWLMPGIQIKVVRIPAKYETQAPTMSMLSPEAADYNRISIYCYDPARKAEADKGRRGMTAIADNGEPGLDYSKNALPTCKEGELVSYKLRNVRNARSRKHLWDAANQDVYEYYTDTTMDRGSRVMKNNLNGGRIDTSTGNVVQTVDVQRYPLLETILCDNKGKCKSKGQGGVLPDNHQTGRTPATATAACEEGKYMYYGWEDRPGGDQDYDDIRLVVACPKEIKVSDKQVHIVK